jgi:putative ABC transport system permease protein
VALAMVALVSAGLFLRSFHNAGRIEPGFNTQNVSVSQFYLSNAGYSAQEQWDFCRRLRERMESKPGVVAVTYSDFVPLSSPGSSPEDELVVEGYVPAPNEQMLIHRATVPPGYFKFMGISLLEGRDFTELDENGAPEVMIVNQTFADRFFHDAPAIGHTVKVAGSNARIVGVVRDSKYDTPFEGAHPYFYLPFRQHFYPGLNFSFMVKTMGDPMLIIADLRREAIALNQDAYFHSTSLSDAVGYSLYTQKIAASLLSVVGMLCVLLAAVGLYSVMNYAVSQRTQEFGIRIALGASRFKDVQMVSRDSLLLAVPGLIAGTITSLAAVRFFNGMLIGVSATDPAIFIACAVFLLAIAILASCIPALRAVRTDPMTAVRCQ